MNAVALVLSIFMLLSWQGFYTSVEGGTVIPTLTVCREMGMGNEAMGTVYNDVLWSLALLLMAMSLVFILIIHLIGRKGARKHG